MVTSLLDGGADVNHCNRGTLWTPLHAATFQEHGKVLYPEFYCVYIALL